MYFLLLLFNPYLEWCLDYMHCQLMEHGMHVSCFVHLPPSTIRSFHLSPCTISCLFICLHVPTDIFSFASKYHQRSVHFSLCTIRYLFICFHVPSDDFSTISKYYHMSFQLSVNLFCVPNLITLPFFSMMHPS